MKSLNRYIKENEFNENDALVIDWYTSEYPEDELAYDLFEYASELTWDELIQSYYDKSPIIEWNDTVIRERIFSELAKRLGVLYDDIYNQWCANLF